MFMTFLRKREPGLQIYKYIFHILNQNIAAYLFCEVRSALLSRSSIQRKVIRKTCDVWDYLHRRTYIMQDQTASSSITCLFSRTYRTRFRGLKLIGQRDSYDIFDHCGLFVVWRYEVHFYWTAENQKCRRGLFKYILAHKNSKASSCVPIPTALGTLDAPSKFGLLH